MAIRIAAGSYTNSKARSMKSWAEQNKDKIRANKRAWRERQKLKKDWTVTATVDLKQLNLKP
jgi:hypothetical protein